MGHGVSPIERLVDHFLQPGVISSSALGRSAEKFSSLIRVARELPEHRDVDLDELVHSLARDFDPYSKPHSDPKDSVDRGFDNASYGPSFDKILDPDPEVALKVVSSVSFPLVLPSRLWHPGSNGSIAHSLIQFPSFMTKWFEMLLSILHVFGCPKNFGITSPGVQCIAVVRNSLSLLKSGFKRGL